MTKPSCTIKSIHHELPLTRLAIATFSVAKDLCLTAIPSLAESRGGELVATVTILMVIATLAVILRLYARKISGTKLGTDDYMIVVALILTLGLDVNSYFAIASGTGRHMITLTLGQITSFVKTYQATQILFGCSITTTKLSILFFYNRLFPYRTFYMVSLITGIVSILWWVGLMLTAFLHCRPFSYNWDRSIPNGHCVNDNLVGYTITSINIVGDLVVLILPIPWLWGMNMAVPKRMAVVGLFVLGSFVCIAGIIRLPFLAELQVSDATYTSINVGVWVTVECNIGILSACLPILRPLFSSKYALSPVSRLAHIFRRLTNSRFSSSSRENLTSDPEKGTSEPSSDATIAEGLKWPNDSSAGGGWKWSRNNSGSVAADSISPVARGKSPTEPMIASRRTLPLGERERKRRTWYTAAAEMLPEIDLQKRWSRKAINPDAIPRYRDDDKVIPEKSAEITAPSAAAVRPGEDTGHDREKGKETRPNGYGKPKRSTRSSYSRLQISIPNSSRQSRRSSWGLARDTWDLMPSVVFWDRGGLAKAINMR
ncbi:MAG: hypothetical protein LQ339_005519 [Xanthoria mediterranea]|nr:MAG: hypothetical protein LQ339_005519 [Xanthoria mediterranea]